MYNELSSHSQRRQDSAFNDERLALDRHEDAGEVLFNAAAKDIVANSTALARLAQAENKSRLIC